MERENMQPAPHLMEVLVKSVLGYERYEKAGCVVFLEVEIDGTVREFCRLILPTATEIAALRTFIAAMPATPNRSAD